MSVQVSVTSRLDELLATIPDERRAALDARAQRFDRNTFVDLASREAPAGAWIVLRWIRDHIAALPRDDASDAQDASIDTAFDIVADRWRRPEFPALAVELIAAIPRHKARLAERLIGAFRISSDMDVDGAIIEGIAKLDIPNRRLLADRVGVWRLNPELAIAWLADPALRPKAQSYFISNLAANEQLLRARVAGARAGARQAIVGLLRRIDPGFALPDDAEGNLEGQLRVRPRDEAAAAVWADWLMARQDPRGELIALELAIARAEPAQALELSKQQAALITKHREQLWKKPGGFPYREKWRGRRSIAFISHWEHKIRGKPENLLERVQRFVETVTDIRAPRYVFIGRRRLEPDGDARPVEPSGLAFDLTHALGGAEIVADAHGEFVRRDPMQPIRDEKRFFAICRREPALTLDYEFQLAWPNTGVPLPHQEGEHHAGGEPRRSALRLYLDGRDLYLELHFPFERDDDPRFVEVHDAICETLGRVLTHSRWFGFAPSADGKKLVRTKLSFNWHGSEA